MTISENNLRSIVKRCEELYAPPTKMANEFINEFAAELAEEFIVRKRQEQGLKSH
jgi:hypothetical protein